MAIAVINTESGAIVKSGFSGKGEANAFVKAQTALENAQARVANFWDRTEFPIAEVLSR